ncbi:glycosyltransferase family 2 protein [Marinimicrobium sp. ABcell2]|uniref:glycosyltransferase family 2 protein n=1 Tax=Marinimicrobium sp. ABcell2 TaxID=3069751 RepID=UPI0027B304ED|nr:glycosyltransferase family 2 protein [Marinimicrobium sp. ABcell2]MDQ2078336.1 glycosyltransferase family 2 protein [Marinimicrobium sp. ABcell2]
MKIAIAAIVKNEATSLLEWIAYHRTVGIKDFILVDNYSSDGTWELLKALRRRGLVRATRFRTLAGQAPQLDAYQQILNRYGRKYDVLAFIDADEYLAPTEKQTTLTSDIEELFADDDVSAVALSWACFGSSSAVFKGRAMVPERFTHRAPESFATNHQYKSLVRPDRVVRFLNPHQVWLSQGSYTMSDGRTLVPHENGLHGFSRDLCWDRLRVNHYVVKSLEEFLVRKSRVGSAAMPGRVKHKEFFRGHDRNDEPDIGLQMLMKPTREEFERLSQSLETATRWESFLGELRKASGMAAYGAYLLRRTRLYGFQRLKYGPLGAKYRIEQEKE